MTRAFTDPWLPGDITGGPVDRIIEGVRAVVPGVRVERLRVTHPGDDDNVWFLSREGGVEAQLDSAPGGRPPFSLESDTDRGGDTDEVDSAIATLTEWLLA